MAHYVSDAEGKLTKIAGKNYKAYMPLGMIFASAVMLEEISVKRLDGQSLSITGTYKDFCNWVMNQGSNVPTCNISTYASEMTTYGQCGKFVINNTSSAQTSGSYTVPAYSIKLPTITEFVASNNGGKELGLAQLDEFKSHNHRQTTPNTYGSDIYNKAFSETKYNFNYWASGYTLNTGGDETRPKNIRYPYYIVVAQGVKPIALADMQQTVKNVEELQDKAYRTEQVEIVYDRYDSNKNFGYGGGLRPNNGTINMDLSKYKRLIVTCDLDSNPYTFIVNLEGATYSGGGIFPRPDGVQMYLCGIKATASTFTVVKIGYTSGSAFTDRNNNDTYKVQKIEGVF